MRRRAVIGLMAGVIATTSWVLASDSSDPFAGAGACKKCHASAFERWEQSLHAKSHRALPERNQQDPRCVQCHGTSDSATGGVQCESCHGAGKHYAKRYVMKDAELSRIVGLEDVAEKTCKRCHTDTAPSIQPYVHDRMWQLISHGLDIATQPGPAAEKDKKSP